MCNKDCPLKLHWHCSLTGSEDLVSVFLHLRELHLDPLKSCRVQVAGVVGLEGEQFG